MSSIRKRRYRRREGPAGLFSGLGPGDPGYRLRPGASGLDPMEAYQEMGRVIGLTLKSLVSGRSGGLLIPSFVILFAGLAWVLPRMLSIPALVVEVDGRWIVGLIGGVFLAVMLAYAARQLASSDQAGDVF